GDDGTKFTTPFAHPRSGLLALQSRAACRPGVKATARSPLPPARRVWPLDPPWQRRGSALRWGQILEEGAAITAHCSLEPLLSLLKARRPALDPASADGPPPPPRRVNHAGEIEIDWPVSSIPSRLNRFRTISFETLEDELERSAEREEHLG